MSDGGKKGRKIGRNKKSPSMKGYPQRAEKNRRRKAAKHERAVKRKAEKIAKRIRAGKPVHSRHKPAERDGS